MNKNEFIAAVADNKALEKLDLSKGTIAIVIETVLETIQNALQKGDEVRLVGFGNFYVAKREASMGRNPRTGADIEIKASRLPKFRPGKQMKEVVNAPLQTKK